MLPRLSELGVISTSQPGGLGKLLPRSVGQPRFTWSSICLYITFATGEDLVMETRFSGYDSVQFLLCTARW